jgi:hypothetical protein
MNRTAFIQIPIAAEAFDTITKRQAVDLTWQALRFAADNLEDLGASLEAFEGDADGPNLETSCAFVTHLARGAKVATVQTIQTP